MSNLAWVLKYLPTIWVLIPVIFIVYCIIKVIIDKEIEDAITGFIALTSYLVYQILIYLVGKTDLEYNFAVIWILKFFMPFFVLMPAAEYGDKRYFDFEKWLKVYGTLYAFWVMAKLVSFITSKYGL